MAGLENISVTVRFRPLTPKELQAQDAVAWRLLDNQTLARAEPKPFAPGDPCYEVRQVFDPTCSTAEVYEAAVKPLVCRTLQGANSCVIVYGPAASGKGHTTWGDTNSPGIIPLAVADLFSRLSTLLDHEPVEQQQDQQQHESAECSLRLSYLEIRNERVYDLLRPGSEDLQVATSPQGGHYVCGQQEELVTDPTSVFQLLHLGRLGRTAAAEQYPATAAARAAAVGASHTLIRLALERRDPQHHHHPQGGFGARISTLTFVDLAGPEHPTSSAAADPEASANASARRHDGRNVNTSLLALHTVVRELALRDAAAAAATNGGGGPRASTAAAASGVHIPYRLSKLTRVLQPSLGGTTRTALICTLSPAARHADSSAHVLAFAAAARQVRNAVQQAELLSASARLQLQADRVADLERQLRGLRPGPGPGEGAAATPTPTQAWTSASTLTGSPGSDDDVDAAAALLRLKLRREKTEYDWIVLRARCQQAQAQAQAQAQHRGGSSWADGQEGRRLGCLQQECAAVATRLRALTGDMVRARAVVLDQRLAALKRAAAKAAQAEQGLTAPVLRRHMRAKLEAVRRQTEGQAASADRNSATSKPAVDRLRSSRSSSVQVSRASAAQPRTTSGTGTDKQPQPQPQQPWHQEDQDQQLQAALSRAAEAESRAATAEAQAQALARALIDARSQLAEARRAAEAAVKARQELQHRGVVLEAGQLLGPGLQAGARRQQDDDALALVVAEQQALGSLQQQQVTRLAGQVEDQQAQIQALLGERAEMARRLEDALGQVARMQGGSGAAAGGGGGVAFAAGSEGAVEDRALVARAPSPPAAPRAGGLPPPGAGGRGMEDAGGSQHLVWLRHQMVARSEVAVTAGVTAETAVSLCLPYLSAPASLPQPLLHQHQHPHHLLLLQDQQQHPHQQPRCGDSATSMVTSVFDTKEQGPEVSQGPQSPENGSGAAGDDDERPSPTGPQHEAGEDGDPQRGQSTDAGNGLGQGGQGPTLLDDERQAAAKPGSGWVREVTQKGGAGAGADQRSRTSGSSGGGDVGRGVRRETQLRRGNVRTASAQGYTLGRQ